MSFPCARCKKTFRNRSLLRLHMWAHTGNGEFQCTKCSFGAKILGRLKAHQNATVHDPPAKCPECSFTSCTAYGIGFHRNHAHGKRSKTNIPKNALLCSPSKTSKSRTILRSSIQHSKSSSLQRTRSFSLKIKASSKTRSLQPTKTDFIRTSPTKTKSYDIPNPSHKPKQLPDEKEKEGREELIIFSCPYCDFKSPLPEDIRSHMRTHIGLKPYKCEACAYKTGTWTILKRHVRSHTGEKPYHCKTCGKAFPYEESYTRHCKGHFPNQKSRNVTAAQKLSKKSRLNSKKTKSVRSTSKNGAYSCHVCEYVCNTRSRLNYHLKLHFGVSLKCQLCPYSTKYNYSLQRHILHLHTLKAPCESCEFIARNKKELASHVRRNHGVVEAIEEEEEDESEKEEESEEEEEALENETKLDAVKYPCSFCPYSTARKHDLNRHEKIHTG